MYIVNEHMILFQALEILELPVTMDDVDHEARIEDIHPGVVKTERSMVVAVGVIFFDVRE